MSTTTGAGHAPANFHTRQSQAKLARRNRRKGRDGTQSSRYSSTSAEDRDGALSISDFTVQPTDDPRQIADLATPRAPGAALASPGTPHGLTPADSEVRDVVPRGDAEASLSSPRGPPDATAAGGRCGPGEHAQATEPRSKGGEVSAAAPWVQGATYLVIGDGGPMYNLAVAKTEGGLSFYLAGPPGVGPPSQQDHHGAGVGALARGYLTGRAPVVQEDMEGGVLKAVERWLLGVWRTLLNLIRLVPRLILVSALLISLVLLVIFLSRCWLVLTGLPWIGPAIQDAWTGALAQGRQLMGPHSNDAPFTLPSLSTPAATGGPATEGPATEGPAGAGALPVIFDDAGTLSPAFLGVMDFFEHQAIAEVVEGGAGGGGDQSTSLAGRVVHAQGVKDKLMPDGDWHGWWAGVQREADSIDTSDQGLYDTAQSYWLRAREQAAAAAAAADETPVAAMIQPSSSPWWGPRLWSRVVRAALGVLRWCGLGPATPPDEHQPPKWLATLRQRALGASRMLAAAARELEKTHDGLQESETSLELLSTQLHSLSTTMQGAVTHLDWLWQASGRNDAGNALVATPANEDMAVAVQHVLSWSGMADFLYGSVEEVKRKRGELTDRIKGQYRRLETLQDLLKDVIDSVDELWQKDMEQQDGTASLGYPSWPDASELPQLRAQVASLDSAIKHVALDFLRLLWERKKLLVRVG